ncbi:MAG: hypothetical protein WCO69_03455 [Candidatus Omnitrophota bacterium]
MIKADLVNPRSLSETVRNDVNSELWMRYICFTPAIRQSMAKGSPRAASLFQTCDRYAALSFLCFAASVASLFPGFLFRQALMLSTGAMCLTSFFLVESIKKKLLIELSKELVNALYQEAPPKGTFFQFGEDLGRRFGVTSFIDFDGKLDIFLKRFFITIYPLALLVYINISWITVLWLMTLTFAWPFFIRPVRILRPLLGLR